MFTVLALATVIALSVIVFLGFIGFRVPKGRAPLIPEAGFSADAPEARVDLSAVAGALLARYGIEVESRIESGEAEFTMHGRSRDPLIGGRYIVVCRECRNGEIIPSTRLLEFRDEVKASGATKGMFLTDGFFTSDARYLLEDAPVSLLNRHDIASLRT
ncbi:MAG: restriction endonuclease [bacterium]